MSGHNVDVESGVGASLRDARKRRDLDLTEVEAAIKIRVRYLQAIEDEDWQVLPGDVYARGFIRTYAAFLGLDGERLAEEYRHGTGVEREEAPRRMEPVGSAVPAGRGRRLGGRALTVPVVLAVGALLVAVGVLGDDGDDAASPVNPAGREDRPPTQPTRTVPARPGVALELTASDEVWVCLLDAEEEALVDGLILAPGEEAGPFRSERFSAAFGNGAVQLTVDGEPARTPASSGPVGYVIDAEGELRALEEGERPDCA
ncbi:MAG TPA: helix-turn-helix domain-containing protein [Solirubrobacterales bacterium]|nr:helix-turn-helix domain-containing protein [Solirubrobacterales bacterium]